MGGKGPPSEDLSGRCPPRRVEAATKQRGGAPFLIGSKLRQQHDEEGHHSSPCDVVLLLVSGVVSI